MAYANVTAAGSDNNGSANLQFVVSGTQIQELVKSNSLLPFRWVEALKPFTVEQSRLNPYRFVPDILRF
jgi:hypothetical protein